MLFIENFVSSKYFDDTWWYFCFTNKVYQNFPKMCPWLEKKMLGVVLLLPTFPLIWNFTLGPHKLVLNHFTNSKNFPSSTNSVTQGPCTSDLVKDQADLLDQWDKRFVNQVSDIPSIIFFIQFCKILCKKPFHLFFISLLNYKN